jgi:flavin reductase (DIM6/NTAB) family NADH-FMN oxidoreductase RutF
MTLSDEMVAAVQQQQRLVSQEAFRGAMGAIPTPVSIVTTALGAPHGTTVSAFASLSLDPPMVLVSLHDDSDLLDMIRQTRRFGLNVLAYNQGDIAARFAKRGIDRFADVDWEIDHGSPRLAGVASWTACAVAEFLTAGDHVIVTGLVESAFDVDIAGLVYQHRRFGHFTPTEPAP